MIFLEKSGFWPSSMFADRHFPTDLTADQLDNYLQKGWFRIAQSIFTTNFLSFNNEIYSAIWLRVRLAHYEPEKKNKRILQQNNRFQVAIGQANILEEHEALYRRYRKSLSFNASSSLPELLFGSASTNIYNTWQVDVRNTATGELIACGFFDLGSKSAAGITSFYDPEYKKFSPGKFLILMKMQYCKDLGIDYFYPGYFAPGYPLFDYKLTMGSDTMEFFDMCDESWDPIDTFQNEQAPIAVMKSRLKALQEALSKFRPELPLYKYEFFEANLYPELQGEDLFDYPVFLLQHHDVLTDSVDLIVYDVATGFFRCLMCYSIWKSNMSEHVRDVYSRHLLKEAAEHLISTDVDEVARFVAERVKRNLNV